MLQLLDELEDPLQYLPPFLVYGLLHDLDLLIVPGPHVFEQELQEPQAAQPPLTGPLNTYDQNTIMYI